MCPSHRKGNHAFRVVSWSVGWCSCRAEGNVVIIAENVSVTAIYIPTGVSSDSILSVLGRLFCSSCLALACSTRRTFGVFEIYHSNTCYIRVVDVCGCGGVRASRNINTARKQINIIHRFVRDETSEIVGDPIGETSIVCPP